MLEPNLKILNSSKLMKNRMLFLVFIALFASCKKQQIAGNTTVVKAPVKPNILFILVDDLGLHDLGFTGSKFYETPNIDALAKKGFVFTQGYANSRVCSPSRASIMLGKFTARHGITDWIGAKTGKNWRTLERQDKLLPATYKHTLKKEDVTIAEALKNNKYTTFFAGKWHLGKEGSYPENHGFDYNVGGWHSGSPKGGFFCHSKIQN